MYEFKEKISLLDPHETIFIISSKSFTTDETLETLKEAIKWSGDIERFIAIITEHCEGNFPLWLAPNQIIILPINENVNEYANNIKNKLEELNFRIAIDTRFEKISRKIRDAEVKKIPFMLVIGDNEMNSSTLSVRKKYEGDVGKMTLEKLIDILNKELTTDLN